MSTAMQNAPRRRKVWPWVAGVVIGAVLVGGAGAWVISSTTSSPSGAAPSAAPGRVPSAAASENPSDRVANGCPVGTDVTAEEVLNVQATRDLTPVGAVEFLAVLLQFAEAADPYVLDGYETVVDSTTRGSMHELAMSVPRSQPAYEDGKNHRKSFAGGGYYIESASEEEVVVSIFGYVTSDGDGASGQNVVGSGSYTLVPSDAGWVVESATDTRSPEDIAAIGTAFQGGC